MKENSGGYTSSAALCCKIKWEDINFPAYYRVAHFSLSELQGGLKRFAIKVYLSFLIILAILCLNCTTKR